MEQRINPLNTSQGRQTSQRSGNAVSGQNAASHRSSSGQTPRSVGGSTGNYGVSRSPSAIHVGDVLRGEITDLTNNEISITLEDNTTVHAKIADSSSYSIGQTGAFRLTEIAGNTLYLENVSKGYTETELTLINKALSEAGLPSTSHNQEAVKALMDNLLPITKTSIQNLMQQSYDFQTEDMNTLAVMNRLMMKMDSDSVAQFSNYRNDNYQLLERLQSFSQDIPALLSALSENAPADAVAGFGKTLLSIGLSTDNMTAQNQTGSTIASLPAQAQNDIAQMLSNTALTEDTASQLDQKTLSLQDALTLLRDAALSGTLKQPQGMSSTELASYLNQINA
ncbi:MAG: hypothetical protein LUH14_05300, partial [Clostridiaceae bacterium]|nr:hypothetical protein [Clostridiaceae bacterium]